MASSSSSSADIMAAFRYIQTHAESVDARDREEHFGKLYPDLQQQYPFLFHKICTDPGMNLSTLEYMLQMRDALKSNNLDDKEASKQVGQAMFDSFVKPMLDS